jgi:phospholipid/cholesterol/gamma-HCH transport system ATP-binding protein
MREYGNVSEELIPAVVRLKLSLVGLGTAGELLPDELSGGMRKRAGLARAMALDPPVIYFDEPSAGLDPIMASGLDELILEIRKLLGITFIIVTHELDSIRKVADRIVMLDRGKVIFTGTVEEAEATGAERVRQFFERRADEHITQRNV